MCGGAHEDEWSDHQVIQWAMQRMFRQYDAIADLLLPTAFVPKEKLPADNETVEPEPQPRLNFGE